jgi:dipeptidase D
VTALSDLEPHRLWTLFAELSGIPRASKHEAAAARWAAERARGLGLPGLTVETDAAGNVLVRKPATPGREGRPGIALQAHLDMVCEKNEGTAHDFSRDPIQAHADGDVVRARGTTLGADNGIGVAAALAALSECPAHPPLEVLLTVDEETGLTGANAVRAGWLRAARLVNLDSEEEGELSIGCAGGQDSQATRAAGWAAPAAGRKALRLAVTGLQGGHSGVDIAAGRGNAIRILAQVLAEVLPAHQLQLGGLRGGTKRNAIPREAFAVVHVEPARAAALAADVARLAGVVRSALGRFDPGLSVSLTPPAADDPGARRALAPADAAALVGFLVAAPNGVEAMSPDIAGLVQTSTNLATVDTTDAAMEVGFLTRSALDDSKALLVARIAQAAALAGFTARSGSGYPGWRPEPDAALVKLLTGTYQRLFGAPMAVKAMHAGLECGIFKGSYPTMEMVSFGPSMWNVHTPDERVSIPSVQRFWRHLVAVLEAA